MRLGNDIVDLEAARGEHERFAERILSEAEHKNYEAAGAGAAQLWSYWAAKEAAFKAYTQLRRTRFAPLHWQVDADFSHVSFEDEAFKLRLRLEQDLIYAEVTDAPWEQVYSETLSLEGEPLPEIQKREVRRLAIQLAVRSLGIKPGDARIFKRDGIPHLLDETRQESYTLSLTHHGRFLAASLLLARDGSRALDFPDYARGQTDALHPER